MITARVACILLCLAPLFAKAESSPNFIVILADDQGWGTTFNCSYLDKLDVEDAEVHSTDWVAAGAFEAPKSKRLQSRYKALPKFCRVTGSIAPTADSDIRFELWLPEPEKWNGKFMQTGNGGAAGSIDYNSMVDPLLRGYAVTNTDTGHVGGGGDFSWAAGQPEKWVDYQYRAVHELTRVGKALTSANFGKEPHKSYWLGCSTGGRQGLKEAQLYPDDYDAIIAGAPASNWVPLMTKSVLIQNSLGENGLGLDKLAPLKEAALAACDSNDGVIDRVISNPGVCGFDPASLACTGDEDADCLTPTEVEAARRIYSGVVNTEGETLIPGTGPGSEPLWQVYKRGFSIGESYYRHLIYNDPEWQSELFDMESALELAYRHDAGGTDAMDPDLSDFVKGGGKLIVYHGTTDGLIPYGNSVNYHESVIDTLGQQAVDDSVRLYLMPGMDHCSGGEGADTVDFIAAMEDWVEHGKAPAELRAERRKREKSQWAPARHALSRVVCPYPQVPQYEGPGDQNNAENFACVMPNR